MQTAEPSMQVNVDDELVEALRRGEDAAFERLVREHGPRMLAVTRRYLRCDAEAQDALQDAFVSAFRAIHAFRGTCALATWLHCIAARAALMRLRSTRRASRQLSLDELLPTFRDDGHRAGQLGAWDERADCAVERAETRDLVRASIDRLPPDDRAVLLARDIDGLSTEEAAQSLGLHPAALKTRLHRARQALRSLLEPHFRGG